VNLLAIPRNGKRCERFVAPSVEETLPSDEFEERPPG
jgi:hypothetical protein